MTLLVNIILRDDSHEMSEWKNLFSIWGTNQRIDNRHFMIQQSGISKAFCLTEHPTQANKFTEQITMSVGKTVLSVLVWLFFWLRWIWGMPHYWWNFNDSAAWWLISLRDIRVLSSLMDSICDLPAVMEKTYWPSSVAVSNQTRNWRQIDAGFNGCLMKSAQPIVCC